MNIVNIDQSVKPSIQYIRKHPLFA